MLAIKDNKEYTITEENKEAFLKEGYDIYDDKGKLVEYSPKKKISYNEYLKVNEELKKASTKNAELTKKNAELTAENKKLITENEKLTKKIEDSK